MTSTHPRPRPVWLDILLSAAIAPPLARLLLAGPLDRWVAGLQGLLGWPPEDDPAAFLLSAAVPVLLPSLLMFMLLRTGRMSRWLVATRAVVLAYAVALAALVLLNVSYFFAHTRLEGVPVLMLSSRPQLQALAAATWGAACLMLLLANVGHHSGHARGLFSWLLAQGRRMLRWWFEILPVAGRP